MKRYFLSFLLMVGCLLQVSAVKVVENGRAVIVRNGVRYSVTGQMVQ